MNQEQHKIPAPRVTYHGKANLRKKDYRWLRISTGAAAAAVAIGLIIGTLSTTQQKQTATALTQQKQTATAQTQQKQTATALTQQKHAATELTQQKHAATELTQQKHAATALTQQKQTATALTQPSKTISIPATTENYTDPNPTIIDQPATKTIRNRPDNHVTTTDAEPQTTHRANNPAQRESYTPITQDMQLAYADVRFAVAKQTIPLATTTHRETGDDDDDSYLKKLVPIPKLNTNSPLKEMKEYLKEDYRDLAIGFNQIKDGIASTFTKQNNKNSTHEKN